MSAIVPFYGTISIKDNRAVRLSDSGSNYIDFRAPTTVTTSYTIRLPGSIVTNGYLKTDASGNLSFVVLTSSEITDFNEAAQDAVGNILTDTSSIDFTYDDTANTISAVVLPAGVNHNLLNNYTVNEHIDHSSVNINTATNSGLAGGGNITASRSLVLDPNNAPTKSTPVGADILPIADSADSFNLKKVTISSVASTALSLNSYKANWTSGTTITLTHDLGTRDVLVQVYDNTSYETIYVDTVERTTVNSVTLTSSTAPSGSGWRVLILRS